MSADFDDLIKTIAVRHGVAVGRDDPILILHTLNEALAKNNEAAMQALFDRQKEELEAMAKRWSGESKAMAERIINAALAAGIQAMNDHMATGAQQAIESLRQEVSATLGQAEEQNARAKGVALLNMTAAIIALTAAGMVVFFGIHCRF